MLKLTYFMLSYQFRIVFNVQNRKTTQVIQINKVSNLGSNISLELQLNLIIDEEDTCFLSSIPSIFSIGTKFKEIFSLICSRINIF